MTKRFYSNFRGRKCSRCNKDLSIGNDHGLRYFDEKGNWDCKSYTCRKCHIWIERHGRYSKDDIRNLQRQYFSEKRDRKICCNCKASPTSYFCNCGRLECTGYICRTCYIKSPDSQQYLLKQIANCRNSQIDKFGTRGIGLIGEATIAKVRKLDILSIKLDNFDYKYDLSPDAEYGIIQAKFKILLYGEWKIGIGPHNFDTLLVLCADKKGNIIERVYAIPKVEVYDISKGIGLHKNPSPSIGSKYDKFQIDPKEYDNSYRDLIIYLKDKRYFGIDDIIAWLNKEE